MWLLREFCLGWPPLPGEERFERAVGAKQRFPSLARDGLDPFAVVRTGGLGTVVDAVEVDRPAVVVRAIRHAAAE